jgi:UDP-4-amino-4,6-dideoxy-N-acetyl-beta-L-altrosamine N-acetyltransferase
MTEEDMPQVLAWRNADHVRCFMFTDRIITEAEHRDWWERTSTDASTRHYVFELDGTPCGVVNVTDIDPVGATASWGLYHAEKDAEPGIGSAMAWLALCEVFGPLGVRKLLCEAFAFNEAALGLYAKMGFRRQSVRTAHRLHGETLEDVVELALFADDWERLATSLVPTVFRG